MRMMDICLLYFPMGVFFTIQWKVNFQKVWKLTFHQLVKTPPIPPTHRPTKWIVKDEVMVTYDQVRSSQSWPKAKEKSFLGGSPPRGQSQLKIFRFAPSFIGVREDEMAKWYKKSESLNENKSSDVLPSYHEDYLVALATCKRTCKFKTQSQLDV